jgi:hypothetical protein
MKERGDMYLIGIFVIILSLFLCGRADATGVSVLSPEGIKKTFLGPKIFHSHSLEAREENGHLVVEVKTNYPGPHADVEYNIADLKIDFRGNRLAVKLSGLNRGNILLNPQWETSQIFQPIGVPFGRYVDGEFIPVQATGGTVIGEAEIEWLEQGNGEYVVKIKISLDCLKNLSDMKGGKITIEWTTAFCGNSLVVGECNIQTPQTGWGGGGPGYILPTSYPATPVSWPSGGGGGFSGGGSGGGSGGSEGGGGGDEDHHHHPVPIPGTLSLFGSGILMFFLIAGGMRMRRRQ